MVFETVAIFFPSYFLIVYWYGDCSTDRGKKTVLIVDFIELVKSRKSVRGYLDRPVSRELIERCLEAARFAPSACNSQPWHFIVVESRKIKERLVNRAFSGVYSINSFVKDAAAFLVVVREPSLWMARLAGRFRGIQYSLIDIGIAVEHFVLEATELGLGTCWLGWFNEGEVKKVLRIPKERKVDIIVSIGYPKEQDKYPIHRKNIQDIAEFV